MKHTTTVYVDTEGIGNTCVEVLASQEENARYIFGTDSSAVVIVPESEAEAFITTVNHMPGCAVRSTETH